ncbi:hypothetical protein [Mycolicibacterium baixiangningiae]|uniref:hypothetical protein n=1 Tax=Mycolicibacterium baixiangningiae TaxID=2761578 RepID=UPI0018D1011A|nr:hypothetical protein [Mycolicibacterium baixiangningiae]
MPDADVTVYHADTVLTLTGNEFDGPGGVVVQDGIIRAVLPATDLGSVSGARTVDFGARVLMPGFVDPHAHAEVAAKATFGMVDVRAPGCRSVVDVLDTANLGRAKDGWVVAQTNPFLSIASAVARRTFHGHELDPGHRVSVYDAADAHRRRRVCARRGDQPRHAVGRQAR